MSGAEPEERGTASAHDADDHTTSPLLGRLGRTYQLEGALRCYPEGDLEADILRRARSLAVEGHGLLTVRFVRAHRAALVIAFQGYRTPERAQTLVNAHVRLDPSDTDAERLLQQARPWRPGAPVWVDGVLFGQLEGLVPGPQPLLRVRSAAGTFLVPAHAPYVRLTPERVDLSGAPEGLLDEPERG